jgi:hypothetical protein
MDAIMTEQEFWAALSTPPATALPTYRLYYGEQGEPLFYSMEVLPGKYIEVDHATYSNPPTHCRVVDGVLQVSKTNSVTKIVPADIGTPCHPNNVSIVVDENELHTRWILK